MKHLKDYILERLGEVKSGEVELKEAAINEENGDMLKKFIDCLEADHFELAKESEKRHIKAFEYDKDGKETALYYYYFDSNLLEYFPEPGKTFHESFNLTEKQKKWVDDVLDKKEIKESADEKIDSEESFREYAEKLFKKAFGDELDADKMNEIVDGILKDHEDDDWGTKVGILKKSI